MDLICKKTLNALVGVLYLIYKRAIGKAIFVEVGDVISACFTWIPNTKERWIADQREKKLGTGR